MDTSRLKPQWLDRLILRFERNPLKRAYSALFIVITACSVGAMIHVGILTHNKTQSAITKEISSGLALIGGFLESADGQLILANLEQFKNPERIPGPVVLRTQYHRVRPDRLEAPVPTAPQSCYVELRSQSSQQPGNVSVCAYVTTEVTQGTWVNLEMEFRASNWTVHQPGQRLSTADVWEITLQRDQSSVRALLALQPPDNATEGARARARKTQGPTRFPIYELTPYQRDANGSENRLSKAGWDGWAYQLQDDAGRTTYRLSVRIDVKSLYPNVNFLKGGAKWPPDDVRSLRIFAAHHPAGTQRSPFAAVGTSVWSLPKLYQTYLGVDQYALELSVLDAGQSSKLVWHYPSDSDKAGAVQWFQRPFTRIVGAAGGGQFRNKELNDHRHAIALKSVTVDIEAIAVAFSYLFVLTLFLGIGSIVLYVMVFRPVAALSREADKLAALTKVSLDSERRLTIKGPPTEITQAAQAFNSLLDQIHAQSQRVFQERAKRLDEEERRRTEQMKAREINLRLVGHELKSPLMTLLSLHEDPNDQSKRHIDRMVRAMTVLFGAASPEAAFAAVPAEMERYDLVDFMKSIADNAPYAKIHDVLYKGTESSVPVELDAGLCEDAVTHILNNANRFRTPGTPITIALGMVGADAVVRIWNQGTPIADDMLEKIFEYGVSEDMEEGSEHQGLGLFVADMYITKMGGSVRAIAVPDGACFEIVLPLALSPED